MKLIKKPFIVGLFSLILLPIFAAGCLGDIEPFPGSSAEMFSALLVPDTNLDLYVYARQERPTIISAKIINLAHDIKVESLAMWGLPSDKSLVFGAGLTFTSATDASEIYPSINFDQNGWKILRDNKIYVVQGVGTAAESLKSAISSNGFKYYTNGDVLESVAMLPRGGGRTKMVAIAVAKPSKQVLDFASGYIGKKNFEQAGKILTFINPDIIITGLYSPHQINVAKALEVFEKGKGISTLDVGMLALIKSRLPGFIVETAAKNLLNDYGFTQAKIGEVTVYKGSWPAPDGSSIPILIRIEGEHIFASISAQQDYAETLITSIYK